MKRLYVVKSNCVLPNGLNGPLDTPTHFNINDVITMTRQGIEIYEVNPKDSSEKVLVTTRNVGNVVFKNSRYDAAIRRNLIKSVREESKPVQTSVERKDNTNNYYSNKKNKHDKYNSYKQNDDTKSDTKEETKTEDTSLETGDSFLKN